MLNRQVFNLLIALFILAAFAIRIPDLDRKPMHTDEAVHAFKTGELLVGQSFRYDPLDFHGPLLHFSAWISARLHGIESTTATPAPGAGGVWQSDNRLALGAIQLYASPSASWCRRPIYNLTGPGVLQSIFYYGNPAGVLPPGIHHSNYALSGEADT